MLFIYETKLYGSQVLILAMLARTKRKVVPDQINNKYNNVSRALIMKPF